jgi:putative endonuclease
VGPPVRPEEAKSKDGGRRARGQQAEALAAAWLEGQGYRILARNHALRRGEVDIVCEGDGVLCFVEVRSRTGVAHGAPEETVDRRKARRVVVAATDWAVRNGATARDMRFDVVAVTFGEGEPRVEHFPEAFDASGGPSPF